jgi:hypothetical protein
METKFPTMKSIRRQIFDIKMAMARGLSALITQRQWISHPAPVSSPNLTKLSFTINTTVRIVQPSNKGCGLRNHKMGSYQTKAQLKEHAETGISGIRESVVGWRLGLLWSLAQVEAILKGKFHRLGDILICDLMICTKQVLARSYKLETLRRVPR